jgi:hypothetical protein
MIDFNTTDMLSKTGLYVVMCKQCISSGDNAVHIKKDCLIPARAITVVGGNKIFAEDVVYMLVSNPKTYTKDQLLIPNSVNEIKGGKTSVAIGNYSNDPKTLRAGSMVGFYEKLDDATTLVNVTNDLSNNWTD